MQARQAWICRQIWQPRGCSRPDSKYVTVLSRKRRKRRKSRMRPSAAVKSVSLLWLVILSVPFCRCTVLYCMDESQRLASTYLLPTCVRARYTWPAAVLLSTRMQRAPGFASRAPRRKTTKKPQKNHKKTTKKPQKNHKKNTKKTTKKTPKKPQKNTKQPQKNTKAP